MIKKTYRILFQGLIRDREAFKDRMAAMGVPVDAVEKMIQGAPIVLKGRLGPDEARKYADAVLEAGGHVTIQEDGYLEDSALNGPGPDIPSFERFTMCPECGLKQERGVVCQRCGYRLGEKEEEEAQE
jgi:hypothetical protein